jgi:hypothetical protein
MDRRDWLLGVVAAGLGRVAAAGRARAADAAAPPPAPAASGAALRSLAVMDLELVDDQNTPSTRAATVARLPRATEQLQRELAERRLYRVVDPSPAKALQEKLKGQQEYLYRCADCAEQIGRLLGVDLVMTSWVQKVSELILNLNVEIHEVGTGRIVLAKSVDMRGNEDASWMRAVRYLVRDMAEKRARNAHYGL